MGVNMAGNCIVDNEAVTAAANEEIIRRYYAALCNHRKGNCGEEEAGKIEMLMKQAGISTSDRKCVGAALKKSEDTNAPAVAIELNDGKIITGKTSNLLGASSAMLINALKYLGNIDDETKLIMPEVIEPVQELKVKHLGNHNPRLHLDEILIALSICATTDKNAEKAMKQLHKLKGCEVHSTVILSQVDENTFRKLGINLTSEPKYQTKKLFHR